MVRTILVLGLLAMVVSAQEVRAQTAPASPTKPAAANAVDPASVQALKDMGAYLQTLKRFGVVTELTGERVLADGQKLQHLSRAELTVQRPNKIRVAMRSARSERYLYYDGKAVTLYTPAQKYYSRVDFTGDIGQLIDALERKHNVQLPLQDLFLFGTPAAPLDKIESAMNAGQEIVGGDVCDHYAFRQGSVDWQIWIRTGDKPLPRKLVIVDRSDEARPQSASLITWNLNPEANPAAFTFTPPKGASKIELVAAKGKK